MGYNEGSTGRATLVLAGPHDAQIDVHAAGEAGARLTILWAVGMLTFTTSDQVRALAEALAESAGSRALVPDRAAHELFDQFVPRYGVTRIAATLGQTPKVTVKGNSDDPSGRAGWAHRVRWVDVNTGPVTFRVLDAAAYTDLTRHVTRAATIGDATLRPARVVVPAPALGPKPTTPRR